MLESKRRAIIFITISLLLASAAGFLALRKVSDLNSELGGMTKIYVAASDIPSRTLIKPEQVTTKEIPNRFVNEDSHVTDIKDFYNNVLVVPLGEDDIITKQMIKPVSNIANENNRLVAIPLSDRVNFDQPLESLDRADIVVSHKFEDKPVTETFMKDVPVAYPMKEGKKFTGIVVEVSAEDAPKIIHMENYADSMRVLKANVGKKEQADASEEGKQAEASSPKKAEKKDTSSEPKKEQQSQPKTTEQKQAEQKKADQKPTEQSKTNN
ncbi:pilus assembly protein CpaB [Cytobacillus oceanisediminis]|uniref:Pilus assembly protein CpaB n=1 Tax=Cytobacillus oceanisediminis TaxID=665099 RepID=A0A2V2ZFK1_9BACI|nr:SAF domain-containing protein [Cytobacillus oceanisediminis]PWW17626.1 pilus assembly protein CpaB [Cytobacillus oceanisediminis]